MYRILGTVHPSSPPPHWTLIQWCCRVFTHNKVTLTGRYVMHILYTPMDLWSIKKCLDSLLKFQPPTTAELLKCVYFVVSYLGATIWSQSSVKSSDEGNRPVLSTVETLVKGMWGHIKHLVHVCKVFTQTPVSTEWEEMHWAFQLGFIKARH